MFQYSKVFGCRLQNKQKFYKQISITLETRNKNVSKHGLNNANCTFTIVTKTGTFDSTPIEKRSILLRLQNSKGVEKSICIRIPNSNFRARSKQSYETTKYLG